MASYPPDYQNPSSRPPSYHGPMQGAPKITVADEKARLISEVNPPTHPINAQLPEASASQPLARETTSLQPFSKLGYPAASHIPESSWKAFVSDLRSAVGPTSGQKALALLAVTGVWIGTCCMPLAAVVGALVWKRAVEKNVAADLDTNPAFAMPSSSQRRTINEVVDQYNTLWRPLGIRVSIEGIDKNAYKRAQMCQCQKEVEYRPGCGGKMVPYVNGRRDDGCCARKCKDCGKWRGQKREKLRDKARKHIVQVTVEKIPQDGTEVVANEPRGVPEFTDEKQEWVKVEGGA